MKKITPVSRSGRFAAGPAAAVAQFTESISFDRRLWRHDILGSMAHATMLQKIGVLTRQELRAIVNGLDAIGRRNQGRQISMEAGSRGRPHEHRGRADRARARRGQAAHRPLAQRPGRPGHAALAAGRNRPDCSGNCGCLQRALVRLGETNPDVLIPGYTHLQRAQPVYLAHHLLAYVEMLERDCERLLECLCAA